MKMKTTIAALSVIMTAGCASPAPIAITTTSYNPSEAAYVHKDGNAVIEGQAFLRTTIGEVRTCAGAEVELIAVTDYSMERMGNIYGNTVGGRRNVIQGRAVDDPDPRYVRDRRKTVCDAEGDFQFTGVAPGDYFLVSTVVWYVPGRYGGTQGAALMKRIQVTGAEEDPIRVLLH